MTRVRSRFRIGPKISGIVLLLLSLTTLVGASGLFYLSQMNNRLNAIVDSSAEKVKLAAYLSRDLGDIVRAEKNTILSADTAEIQQWTNTTDVLLATVAERQAGLETLADAEGLALLARFDGHLQAYLALNRQVRDLAAAGSLEEAAALSAGAARDAVSLATADMDALVAKNEVDMDAAKQAAEANFGQARNLMLGFTALALAAGLALGLVVSHSISSNLEVMVRAAGGIADGDVSQEVAVESRDETGDLAVAFGRMIAYLEEMARVAARVASGDVEVRVAPRSERDTLGLALRQMVSNLKDMAWVATRVAGGDLEVQVAPRSKQDTLGLAMRQMVADLKQAGERVSHLNAVLEAVRSVNQLIVREKDRERLIQGACDCLIETRGFLSAWIALVDQAPGTVTAAQAGLGEAFAPVAEALERGEFPPCGQRVLQQAGVLVLDVSPDTCPDCPLVASHGSRLVLATRLEHGGQVYGLLAVSFPEGFAFDEQERQLLAEVAGDMGFGLHSIEQEEALCESEERFRSLFENVLIGLYRTSPDGRVLMANQALVKLLGHSSFEELANRNLEQNGFEPGYPRSQFKELIQRQGYVVGLESAWTRTDGSALFLRESARAVRDEQGKVLYYEGTVEDITERKRAEEALRKSEERFALAVRGSDAGVWDWDIQDHTLYWSPRLKELLGYADDEVDVSFDMFESHLHPDDREHTAAAIEAHLKDRTLYHVEQRLRTKSGEYRWFLARGQALWDEAGNPLRMVGSTTDITERKRADEALEQRASQLALLNEIGSQVAALLDLDGVLDRAARLVQERFGFHHVGLFIRAAGEDRLVMRARAGEFASLFPADHAVALGQGMVGWVGLHGETLLANDVAAEPRYVNPYPDRLPTRAELSVPIRIGDEVVGVLDLQSPLLNAFEPSDVATKETLASQIAVAINNARLYSQAAQRNRELTLLNRVIAATAAAAGQGLKPVLEVVCRELALAFEVPQAAAALFNNEKTEAVVVAEYPSPSSPVAAPQVQAGQRLAPGRPSALGKAIPVTDNPAFQHLLKHKTPLVIDDAQSDPRLALIRDLTRSGQRGTVSLLLLPLTVDSEVVGSLGIDALERRPFSAEEVNLAWRVAEQMSGALARARLEEQRQQLEEQFLQAQKLEAIGRLAGGIAHDFNNLLTVIHLSARLLERKLLPQDPLREHVKRIRDAGQRAASLTGQLLAFSRREIVEPRLLDLNQVIGNLDDMLRRILGEDVELRTIPAEALWPVKIDPSQMDQVILNLVVNARDAMPGGGNLTIETANVVLDRAYTARHLDVEPGEYVLLAVSDTGVGMDEKVKAHLFEPFFTTKEKGKGTGLGLATVHGIVKQNKGHIWVYSEPGQGTAFKVYLPRAPIDARPPAQPLPQGVAPSARGAETLLLVEDEEQVRELARDILTAQGYQVLAAKDGVEALQVAREHDGPIHLLFSDVVMPRMSGRALADELRSSHPEMRVLYTSGYTDNAIVHHGVLEEGTHFLSKPFDTEMLAQKVRSVLDGTA